MVKTNRKTGQTQIVRVSKNLAEAIKAASENLAREMGTEVTNVDASSYIAEIYKKSKKGGSLL